MLRRRVLVPILMSISLTSEATAFWETPYSNWPNYSLETKIAYLSGFMKGHLHFFHVGDHEGKREQLKQCLSFAGMKAFDEAMVATVVDEPELRSKEVGHVVMRTFFRMCGPLKN